MSDIRAGSSSGDRSGDPCGPALSPASETAEAIQCVVVAGGESRRLGGTDKMSVTIGGRTLLDRVLAACPATPDPIVVGPERPTVRPVRWAREHPPGGGPAIAVAAALPLVRTRAVALLSGDLPWAADVVPRLLLAAHTALRDGLPGAWAVDAAGDPQPLVSVVSAEELRRLLGSVRDLGSGGRGASLRRLLATLPLRAVPLPDVALSDVDTWEDVRQARRRDEPEKSTEEHTMEQWIDEVAAALGIEAAVLDVDAVLDLARDVAHEVERKGAPLTTYLVGYAAGRAAASGAQVDGAALAGQVAALARARGEGAR